jgi:hypothetical protein
LLEYFGEEHRRDLQPHDLFDIIATLSRDFAKAKDTFIAEAKKKKREERKRQGKIAGIPNQTPRSAGPKGRADIHLTIHLPLQNLMLLYDTRLFLIHSWARSCFHHNHKNGSRVQ